MAGSQVAAFTAAYGINSRHAAVQQCQKRHSAHTERHAPCTTNKSAPCSDSQCWQRRS